MPIHHRTPDPIRTKTGDPAPAGRASHASVSPTTWRPRFGMAAATALLTCTSACGGGSGPGAADTGQIAGPGTIPEVVAAVRSMLADPQNPDPWLVRYSEVAVAAFASGAPATQVYHALEQSYLSAIETTDDLARAQIAAWSSSSMRDPAAAAPLHAGTPLASATSNASGEAIVYFVNGINTKELSAINSKNLLQRRVHEAHPQLTNTRFDFFYNRSGTEVGSTTSNVCNLVLGGLRPHFQFCLPASAFTQEICSPSLQSLNAEWERVRDLCVAGGGFLADLSQAAAQWVDRLYDSLVPDAAFEAQTLQLAARLEADVAAGRAVVVVCHSQGNFFTEAAVNSLPPVVRNQIGVVSVASPIVFEERTSYGYFGYHLLEQDAIRIVPTAPQPNRSNAKSAAAAVNGCNSGLCYDGIAVHDFAGSYLEYPESSDPIVADVFRAIQLLRPGIDIEALPSPAAGSTGSPSLLSVTRVGGSGAVAVTWTRSSNSVHNVFLMATGGWSSPTSVPFGATAITPATSWGSLVVLGDAEYAEFIPGAATSGATSEAWISANNSAGWFRSEPNDARATFVRRGPVPPNAPLVAKYGSGVHTWQTFVNTTSAPVETDGLVLPYSTGFQVLRAAAVAGGQYTLTARFHGPRGTDLGAQTLRSSSTPVFPIGSGASFDERHLLVSGGFEFVPGQPLPTGVQVRVHDFHPLTGWSNQPVGSVPNMPLYSQVALGRDGQAVIVNQDANGIDCLVFWRERGNAPWQQETFANVGVPTGCGVSDGGILVVTNRDSQLTLLGKRFGDDQPWRQRPNTDLDGALPASTFGVTTVVQPTYNGRFLVVVSGVAFSTFTVGLFAALVRV